MDIAARVKLIRGGVRQEDFADRLGVKKNTVGRWERGEQIPDAENLAKILDSYPDINPSWLLTGEGNINREKELGREEVRWHENRRFLTQSSMIDFYLNSKHYENIPSITRAKIYSVFYEKSKEEGSGSPRIISSIISDLYEPSFTMHDYDINSLIHKFVDEKFKNEKKESAKNQAFWDVFDELCEKFCSGRVIAPIKIKKQIIDWINAEIKKYSGANS